MSSTSSIRYGLVMAASRLSSLDSHGTPKCLIHVGERALIHHVLQQLHSVGVEMVVVTLGYEAEKIKQYITENSVFTGMEIKFVYLAENVWSTRGHAFAILSAREFFSEPFLISAADHIYHPELMRRMAVPNFSGSHSAIILVEEDMEGMIGLPGSAVQVSLSDNKEVLRIGKILPQGTVSALNAGLFSVKPEIFDYLEKLSSDKPYFTLIQALDVMSKEHKVKAISTSGLNWFAIETPESLQYALEKHNKFDSSSWLKIQSSKTANNDRVNVNEITQPGGDVIKVVTVGSASKSQKTPSGGQWSEFSVEKWRSAVFTSGDYFSQLYKDTERFALETLKLCGGRESSTIIEVGCGTGEFLYPLIDHSKYAIGLDVNPVFIKWCNQNLSTPSSSKSMFICGDAQHLFKILKEKANEDIWNTKRIVCCVGNTLGIIPELIRDNIIDQMGEVAGPDGYVLIVYWNAESFPDAVVNFYGKNPQLCGPFEEKHIDFQSSTLKTPSGYSTTWTSPQRAEEIIEMHNLPKIKIEGKGRGTLVLARGKSSIPPLSPSQSTQLPLDLNSVQNQNHSSRSPSISPSPSRSPSSRRRGSVITPQKALVMAASRLGSLDSLGTPKCLVQVGGIPLIIHVLKQLASVGVNFIVVTLGWEGEKIKNCIHEHVSRPESQLSQLEIKFVYLAVDIWAVRGHACAILQAKEYFVDDIFFISTSDHIFHPDLIKRMACSEFIEETEAIVLIEEDMDGMVGLPGSSVQVSLESKKNNKNNKRNNRKFHPDDRFVLEIGRDLSPESVDGLDAGLFVVKPTIFKYLSILEQKKPYFTLSESLNLIAQEGKLKAVSTNNLTWFAVETPESLQYALEKHKSLNTSQWFHNRASKGRHASVQIDERSISGSGPVLKIVGFSPKVSGPSGGTWSEFSVDNWKSAIYTSSDYLKELHNDTNSFILHSISKYFNKNNENNDKDNNDNNNNNGVTVVEVGCGRGETLMQIRNKNGINFVVGVDLVPEFIQWCEEHIPREDKDRSVFLNGDAQYLGSLLKKYTKKYVWCQQRVVLCVGNTYNMLTQNIQSKVVKQMAITAGSKGLILMVHFNAEWFSDAIDNYYGKHPNLCGEIKKDEVDFKNNTLQTASGFFTHWMNVEEAKEILVKQGIEVLSIEAKGKGIFVIARGLDQ